LPPQSTRPAWQESWQEPPEQTWPEAQAVPQVPQLALSEAASTHFPPQSMRPDWQERAQVPPLQTSPEAQTDPDVGPEQLPEAPQKARSESGSTHLPPQSTSPAWQDNWQAPPEQVSPSVQAWPASAPAHEPEAPQWVREVKGSVQTPLQSTSPAWQESWQVPPAQTCPSAHIVPAFGFTQFPLAPQKVRSVSGSMQSPPQSTRPGAQVRAQAPLEQTRPSPQATPHAPQLALSEATDTH
jgi:hypothetical protein